MQLGIHVSSNEASRIVTLTGECDLATAPKLQDALTGLKGPDVAEVVVDVSKLDFIDSTGLGVLVGALKRLRESGSELKIAGAHGSVQRVLNVTGLDRIIPQLETVESAEVTE